MSEIKHVSFPIKRNGTTPKVYDAKGKYLFWITLAAESNALEELREKGESWLDFRNRTDPMREALVEEEVQIADFIITAVNAYDLLTAQNEWLKDRLANLQLPPNSPLNIEDWLADCGMPTAAKEISA
jgi:hypothetical protein